MVQVSQKHLYWYFGLDNYLLYPIQLNMFSSISSFYLLNINSTDISILEKQKCLQILPNVPCGRQKCLSLRTPPPNNQEKFHIPEYGIYEVSLIMLPLLTRKPTTYPSSFIAGLLVWFNVWEKTTECLMYHNVPNVHLV